MVEDEDIMVNTFDEVEVSFFQEKEESDDINPTELVKNVLDAIQKLDDLDDYFEKLSSLQSKVDEELSDLLHFIENPKNKLTNKQSSKLIDLIKEKRIERRNLLNDFEIKKVFNDNRNKICYTNQRQFFLNAINKKNRELNNEYKPRILSDDEILDKIK